MDAKHLSPSQLDHLLRVVKESSRRIEDKYAAGAKEHGGVLLDLSSSALLDAAIDEAVDQIVYLLTLREKLSENCGSRWWAVRMKRDDYINERVVHSKGDNITRDEINIAFNDLHGFELDEVERLAESHPMVKMHKHNLAVDMERQDAKSWLDKVVSDTMHQLAVAKTVMGPENFSRLEGDVVRALDQLVNGLPPTCSVVQGQAPTEIVYGSRDDYPPPPPPNPLPLDETPSWMRCLLCGQVVENGLDDPAASNVHDDCKLELRMKQAACVHPPASRNNAGRCQRCGRMVGPLPVGTVVKVCNHPGHYRGEICTKCGTIVPPVPTS